jgi:hypothetical protein
VGDAEGTGYRQTKTTPTALLRTSLVKASEGLKNVLSLACSDLGAIIAHVKDCFSVRAMYTYGDLMQSMTLGICAKVPDDLQERVSITNKTS